MYIYFLPKSENTNEFFFFLISAVKLRIKLITFIEIMKYTIFYIMKSVLKKKTNN